MITGGVEARPQRAGQTAGAVTREDRGGSEFVGLATRRIVAGAVSDGRRRGNRSEPSKGILQQAENAAVWRWETSAGR